jgi:hypothetical protein
MQNNRKPPHSQPDADNNISKPTICNTASKPVNSQTQPMHLGLYETPTKVTRFKRKYTPSPLAVSAKKQKLVAVNRNADEPTQHPLLNPIQPLSNSIWDKPLTNIERWRMRGWMWPEAVFRMSGNNEDGEMESPRGTKDKTWKKSE